MRFWRITEDPLRCGYCGEEIPAGQPVQIVQLPGLRRTFLRCTAETCAVGPVDWAEIEASRRGHRVPAAPSSSSFTSLAESAGAVRSLIRPPKE